MILNGVKISSKENSLTFLSLSLLDLKVETHVNHLQTQTNFQRRFQISFLTFVCNSRKALTVN